MTQKIISKDKSSSDLLQTIDPKGIADESMRQTVEILLNLIEQLQLKVKDLESENQRLKDENNRLKGEQGNQTSKPTPKGSEASTPQRKNEKRQKSTVKGVRTRRLKSIEKKYWNIPKTNCQQMQNLKDMNK